MKTTLLTALLLSIGLTTSAFADPYNLTANVKFLEHKVQLCQEAMNQHLGYVSVCNDMITATDVILGAPMPVWVQTSLDNGDLDKSNIHSTLQFMEKANKALSQFNELQGVPK